MVYTLNNNFISRNTKNVRRKNRMKRAILLILVALFGHFSSIFGYILVLAWVIFTFVLIG
jgi:hypothetical protein